MENLKIKDKRVIVVNESDNTKYTLPDNYQAGLFMGGTGERVRQKLVKGNDTPIYEHYRVYHYTESKWEELTKKGYKDGDILECCRKFYNRLFGGIYS